MLPKLFLFSMLISSLILAHSYDNKLCLDHQKTLLLQLKNELIFNSSVSSKLVQWSQRDEWCCKWHGVECDIAGNVISLQLDGESISGGIGDSSSLIRLKHLQRLNLAYNEFDSAQIPRGIHNLTYLTHLNLSNAVFSGQVPAEISSLTRLVSLDISNTHDWYQAIKLEYPNLKMLLQNMTELREVNLDSVTISPDESEKWSHIISSYLPHLTSLSMRDCYLSGPFARSFGKLHSLSILRLDGNYLSTTTLDLIANFSSLTTLSLADCYLKGSFPEMIFQIPTLQKLDLSRNDQLRGSIPPFTQTGSLKSLVLRGTSFSGSLPSSISHLKTLSEIDLSGCKFTGAIPSTFANMSELIRVDLSNNMFTGTLSSSMFGGLSDLVYLGLGSNSFSGEVNVSNIVINDLDLSYNHLQGPIPDSFFQLESLESLLLQGNMFNGSFQLDKIQSLANLIQLDLSFNNMSVDVGNHSTYGLPKLEYLGLASCNLHRFPEFIKHSDISLLDLSNNHIIGEIPSWIWGTELWRLNLSLNLLTDVQKPYHIPASLEYLDLHSNQLRGDLHLLIPPDFGNPTSKLWFLSLANNSLSGSIPTSLCTFTNLNVVDLSGNRLNGSIPSCLVESIAFLNVLDLGRNNISGLIPDSFPVHCFIQYLVLNNNNLQGRIPKSLRHCNLLELMDLENNIIEDTFPCMLSSTLRVLVLHSNRFHGEVSCQSQMSWPDLQLLDVSSNNFSGSLDSIDFLSWGPMVLDNGAQLGHEGLYVSGYYRGGVRIIMKGLDVQLVKIWPDFTAIDLSCNHFGGEIPNAMGDLCSLHLLNLSHNAFNGSIPKSFGKLREIESLDLSQNNLTGAIPEELAVLTFLSVLNLSYNKLIGKIPSGRQLQTFSADSFRGNAGLCGFNLNISCTGHTDDLSHEKGEEEKAEIEWEYVSAAFGYVVGLGSFVWLLLFCRSFRRKCFNKIDEIVEDIFHARDMRRRRRRSSSARTRLMRNQAVRRRQ